MYSLQLIVSNELTNNFIDTLEPNFEIIGQNKQIDELIEKYPGHSENPNVKDCWVSREMEDWENKHFMRAC